MRFINRESVFDSLKGQTDVEIFLSEYDLDSVPKDIQVLKSAKRLYIAKDTSGWIVYPPLSALGEDNSTKQPRYLPGEISELSNLNSLTLVNLDLVTLPKSIDHLSNLDTLVLFMNRLTISSELDKLKRLKKLKYLGLLGNNVTANDLIEIKRSIPGIKINPDLH